MLDFCDASEDGSRWLVELSNAARLHESVPDAWHFQRVAMICKKGDLSDCGTYGLICLLNAAYKIFFMLSLQRLLMAGADSRM